MNAVVASIFLFTLGLPAASTDSCALVPLLLAYAHNDYRNRPPLFTALALGYRGVEADVFRQGTDLLVGHERSELQPARTLVRLYLDPLRARLHSCGFVLSDSSSFLLNVDIKEADPGAFRLLSEQLLAYDELFRPPAPGLAPPVQATLVGWWPGPAPGPAGTPGWIDHLRTQLQIDRDPGTTDTADLARVGLVSIDYGKVLRWRGRGAVPPAAEQALVRARRLAERLAVPLRVHHAPERRSVYRWLIARGVTVVGATNLGRTRALLKQLSGRPPPTHRELAGAAKQGRITFGARCAP